MLNILPVLILKRGGLITSVKPGKVGDPEAVQQGTTTDPKLGAGVGWGRSHRTQSQEVITPLIER